MTAMSKEWRDAAHDRMTGYDALRYAKELERVRLKDAERKRKQQERNRRCGAKNRRGTPCKMLPIAGRKRCKYHGGLSTGPRTLEGRIRALSGLNQYKDRPELLAARIAALKASQV